MELFTQETLLRHPIDHVSAHLQKELSLSRASIMTVVVLSGPSRSILWAAVSLAVTILPWHRSFQQSRCFSGSVSLKESTYWKLGCLRIHRVPDDSFSLRYVVSLTHSVGVHLCISVCVRVCGCAQTTAHLWRSEDSFLHMLTSSCACLRG